MAYRGESAKNRKSDGCCSFRFCGIIQSSGMIGLTITPGLAFVMLQKGGLNASEPLLLFGKDKAHSRDCDTDCNHDRIGGFPSMQPDYSGSASRGLVTEMMRRTPLPFRMLLRSPGNVSTTVKSGRSGRKTFLPIIGSHP